MLSDRLTLAKRKQFSASSEKYAKGYEQMNLFNEAEASADAETEELFEEIRPSSYKRKKRKGRKKIFPILRPLRLGPINWKEKPVTVQNAKKIQRSNKRDRNLQSLRMKKRSLMYTAVRNAGP